MSSEQASYWAGGWSTGAGALTSSAIRELLRVTEQPGMISFAGGLPAPEAFPAEEIAIASEQVLAKHAHRVLQYGPTEGFPPLRDFLAGLMQQRGLKVQPDDLLLLSGSQQGLDLVGKLFVDPGAPVLVENPTYLGALQAWAPYRPSFVTLAMDDRGLRLDALEAALADLERAGTPPRFLYTVAAFQNPTGVTLAAERRAPLLEIAERHRLLIVEDDPYGELRYSGEAPPTLAALDTQRHGRPHQVIYFSTFSKLLAPGLRVGWTVAPEIIRRRMVQAKQGLDLHTGTLAQAIAYEACRDGLLERHTPRIRALYHARRDAMLHELEHSMPAGVHWTKPDGGMFLWLTLPEGISAQSIFQQALTQGVAFVPGGAFHANGGGDGTLRLNFSFSPVETIIEGVQRLAAAFR